MSNFVQREDRLFDPVTGAYVGYIDLSGREVLLGVGGGSGTVTSVSVAAPAAGITASVATSTTTPAITLALADDLAAVEGLAATGIVRRTATSAWSAGTAVDLAAEVTGILPTANGGTGVATRTAYAPVFGGTTATGPTQSGTAGSAGQVLTSNGGAALPTFQTPAAGGTPGGTDTQPQFNNAGAFAGMVGVTWVFGTSTYTFGGGVVVNFAGATSGLAQLKAPAVAGTAVITMPGVTSTLATLGANTFSGGQIVNSFLQVGSGSTAIGISYFSTGQINLTNSGVMAWSSTGSIANAPDFFIGRAAAAVGQLGAADAASPAAQTLRTQGSRAGTDTNVGAGKLTLGPGPGTGTGTLASLDLVSPVAVASGTGVQTQTRGLQILSGVAVRTVYAVSALPTATAALKGGVAWVNDATMGMITGYGTVPIGGGANEAPVSCNGTAWVIG